MAYKVYRIRQKNDTGSYDIFHIESNAGLIIRFNDQGVENGTVEDSLKAIEGTLSTLSAEILKKANKVTSATANHFAALGADGDLIDSGKKADDFSLAGHTHTGTEVIVGAADGSKIVVTDASGKLAGYNTVTLAQLAHLAGATSNIQTQLNNKAAANHDHEGVYVKETEKGTSIPTMTDGKIDSQYLPSFVDDVLDGTYVNTTTFNNPSGAAYAPETGKIYVDTTTNKTYRWSGTQYAEISAGVTLGTTSATAFRGDYGQIAYNHSQAAHARTDATAVSYKSNGVLTINGTDTTIYTHPTFTTTKSTGNSSLTHGGTFKALTAVTADNGHVTGYTETTFTLPTTVGISFAASQPTDQKTNDLWFEQLA